MKKLLGWFCFILLSCLAFYYSWLKEPSFLNQSDMPQWFIQWTDNYHVKIWTLLLYFILGFLGFLFEKNRIKAFILFVSYSFLLSFFSELCKLLLPMPFPDWRNIVTGIFGGILGFGIQWIYETLKTVLNKKK